MRRVATAVGIVVVLLVVGAAGAFASFLAWPVGAVATGLVFAGIGWATRRFWTAIVLPVVVAVWAGLTYLSEPSGWHEGHDVTTAGWFEAFGVGAAVAAAAIGLGVLLRRAHDRATGASRPSTTRTGSR